MVQYTSLKALYEELNTKHPIQKMGIAGFDAMSYDLGCTIRDAFPCDLVNINDMLFKLRLDKSEHEAACLREAGRIAEGGVKAVMNADIIGMSEHQAASIGEAACRAAGAEAMIFTLFSSRERTETIVGKSSGKIIEEQLLGNARTIASKYVKEMDEVIAVRNLKMPGATGKYHSASELYGV